LPPASAGNLLDLLFDPEDVGDIFLRNVGLYSSYTAYKSETRGVYVYKSNEALYIRSFVVSLDKLPYTTNPGNLRNSV
jgi:hypothetical protein